MNDFDPVRFAPDAERPAEELAVQQVVRIVLPALNEADGLAKMFESFRAHLDQLEYEIIVVDDGSTDDTAEVALEASPSVRLIRHECNQGLAAAIDTGLRAATELSSPKDLILTMDADNTHPIDLIPRMAALANEGYDVVIASRFRRGAEVHGVPAIRQLTSWVAGGLFKVLLPIKGVRDYTCGFRIYRVESMKKAIEYYGADFVSEQGFSCMVDLLLKLARCNAVMCEVPMRLRYDLKHGASKMNVSSTIFSTLKLAARRRYESLFSSRIRG